MSNRLKSPINNDDITITQCKHIHLLPWNPYLTTTNVVNVVQYVNKANGFFHENPVLEFEIVMSEVALRRYTTSDRVIGGGLCSLEKLTYIM